jgi:hypothetical protein
VRAARPRERQPVGQLLKLHRLALVAAGPCRHQLLAHLASASEALTHGWA